MSLRFFPSAMAGVENFEKIRGHLVEDVVGITNQGNDPNARPSRDLPRASRPLADPALDRQELPLKSLICGREMRGYVNQDVIEIVERFVGINNLHPGRRLANAASTSSGITKRPCSAARRPRSIPASSLGVGR